METVSSKQFVEYFMKKNLLVSANFLEEVQEGFDLGEFENKMQEKNLSFAISL